MRNHDGCLVMHARGVEKPARGVACRCGVAGMAMHAPKHRWLVGSRALEHGCAETWFKILKQVGFETLVGGVQHSQPAWDACGSHACSSSACRMGERMHAKACGHACAAWRCMCLLTADASQAASVEPSGRGVVPAHRLEAAQARQAEHPHPCRHGEGDSNTHTEDDADRHRACPPAASESVQRLQSRQGGTARHLAEAPHGHPTRHTCMPLVTMSNRFPLTACVGEGSWPCGAAEPLLNGQPAPIMPVHESAVVRAILWILVSPLNLGWVPPATHLVATSLC